MVPEGPVHRLGAPADRLPAQHDLGLAPPRRHTHQVGPCGLFNQWFPLPTTLAAAWLILGLAPSPFGAPLATICLFGPSG